MADSVADRLVAVLVKLCKQLLERFPNLVLRFLDIAFNPAGHLRQLALVLGVQICSFLLQRLRNQMRRGILFKNQEQRDLDAALTYADYKECQRRIEGGWHAPAPTLRNNDFFAQLQVRAANYAHLQATGDQYGLMFHLRSELMRKQSGGAGYSRDGSTWLRKHRAARERIQEYQNQVCQALRYIASGSAPGSSRPAQRLAFINETRHAFGRTALLLSGGAAFGVKHLGVVSALQREKLLPRIIAGTSAGSIVAAAVCSRRDDELRELLDVTGPAILETLKFFGLRRGESSADLARLGSSADVPGSHTMQAVERAGGMHRVQSAVEWNFTSHLKRQQEGESALAFTPLRCCKTMLDNRVLESTLLGLIGYITFLEAFDRTGRVLNITVTRSDGKAPPLLCNYLTTPHMLVHCASLASCAIPGVFDAVELQAKGRDGGIEPYFKTGGWTWTDGGLQADLPKERLTELFNVNQFIVSQVSPLAPLVVPIDGTGLPWLEEFNRVLKCQLIGFLQGVNKLWSGRLLRPGGFRGVDFIMQDYEGTVTIRPAWGIREMGKFLANFDQQRVARYTRDGESATWPHLELIRSLCEIEFCLDEVAAGLQQSIALSRATASAGSASAGAVASAEASLTPAAAGVSGGATTPGATTGVEGGSSGGGNGIAAGDYEIFRPSGPLGGVPARTESVGGATPFTRGKLPSYISLAAYDGQEPPAYPVGRGHGLGIGSSSGGRLASLPGVASSASMLNLAALDHEVEAEEWRAAVDGPSIGMAPFQ